jgi:hypothetical protein
MRLILTVFCIKSILIVGFACDGGSGKPVSAK